MPYTFEEIEIAKEKIYHIKNRCARKHLIFDISLDDMLRFNSVSHCQITNVPLIHQLPEETRSKFNVRTLDRIDNKQGYISSNIMVICYSANKLKAKFEDPNNTQFVINNIFDIIEHIKTKLTKEFKMQKLI